VSERPESGDQHDGETAELRPESTPSESPPSESPSSEPTSSESQSPGSQSAESTPGETTSAEHPPSGETTEQPAAEQAAEPTTTTPEQDPDQAAAFGTPTSGGDRATGDAAATGTAGAAGARLPPGITTGLLVAAVGALVTVLAAFLTWASVEVTSRVGSVEGGGTRSLLGVQGGRLGKETLVLALAALALVLVMRAPSSRSWGWIALLVAGVLVVALASLDLAFISDASDLRRRLAAVPGCSQAVQCTGDRSAGVGVYLTILGGLAIAVGALLHHGIFDRLRKGRTPSDGKPSPTPTPTSTPTPTAKQDVT
jgi:hypothetical protein